MSQVWRETFLEQVMRMIEGVDDAEALNACDVGWRSPGQSVGGN